MIGDNLSKSCQNTNESVHLLKEAEQHQSQSNQKSIWCITIVGVAAVALLFLCLYLLI